MACSEIGGRHEAAGIYRLRQRGTGVAGQLLVRSKLTRPRG